MTYVWALRLDSQKGSKMHSVAKLPGEVAFSKGSRPPLLKLKENNTELRNETGKERILASAKRGS